MTSTCDLCSNPSARVYSKKGMELNLCELCFDFFRVKDAYEAKLIDIAAASGAGRYERVLEILDEVWETNAAYDRDGWLERTILSHRALLLAEKGEIESAVAVLREVSSKTLDAIGSPRSQVLRGSQSDLSEFINIQHLLAESLDRLGRKDEALAELEKTLSVLKVSDRVPLNTYDLLSMYVEVSRKQRAKFSAEFKRLVTNLLNEAVRASESLDWSDTASLLELIGKAKEIRRVDEV